MAFVVSHSIAADSLPWKHCFLCVQHEIINIRTPQKASGDGNLRTGLCRECRKVSELKNAVISSKPPHFWEKQGIWRFSWAGWLVFLPLVSLWFCIFHYDLQAWFLFQSLNMGLSPSMVLIHGIHLPKSFLPSHPATFRKTQEGTWWAMRLELGLLVGLVAGRDRVFDKDWRADEDEHLRDLHSEAKVESIKTLPEPVAFLIICCLDPF